LNFDGSVEDFLLAFMISDERIHFFGSDGFFLVKTNLFGTLLGKINPEDSPDFGDSLADTFEASPVDPHSQGLLHSLHFCYVVP